MEYCPINITEHCPPSTISGYLFYFIFIYFSIRGAGCLETVLARLRTLNRTSGSGHYRGLGLVIFVLKQINRKVIFFLNKTVCAGGI